MQPAQLKGRPQQPPARYDAPVVGSTEHRRARPLVTRQHRRLQQHSRTADQELIGSRTLHVEHTGGSQAAPQEGERVDESATIVLGDAQDARGAHGAIGHVQRVPVLCPVVASLKHAGRAVVSGSVSSAELKEGRCTAARASIS
eukprot:jgi/Chrpa1/7762/Chrysochromulina_OHIO_Genome00016057-RA